MGSDQPISLCPRQSFAVKAFCRILAAAFLSLLLPLSFLLLARLSTARYFSSTADASSPHLSHNSFLTLLFVKSETTLILCSLVSLMTVAALANSLTGGRIPYVFTVSERCCFRGAWILLFLIQICLSLGIHGTIDAEINSYTIGSLLLPRRVALVLGLHESMVFWWRCVVRPVVDETVCGLIRVEFEWVEKAGMAVAFGYLWWRRLRDEAEAMVVLPWVKAEMRMGVGLADIAGWCIYYLTVAIGVVRVVRGGAWVAAWIYRHGKKI